MPTHINGRPVKTGSWVQEEDDLLSEWQAKLGNRCGPAGCCLLKSTRWQAEHGLPHLPEKAGSLPLQRPVQTRPAGVTPA